MDFAEELLHAQHGAMQAKILGHEGEAATCNAAVDEAKTALAAAEAELDNRMSELVGAEDAVSAAKDVTKVFQA